MDLDLVSDKTEVRDTIYVAFVGFTIMIWDHIDTFTTEVECIWPRVGEKKPKSVQNRYLIPLGFTVNLYAYLKMDYERLSSNLTRKWVVAGVTALLLVEIGTYSWLMSTGQPVQHHPEITSCTMIFGEKNSVASSSSAWLPLLYDTVVLILTLGAIVPSVRHSRGSATIYVMKRLLKDGLIYYSAIFAVTLVLSVMIAVANSGLKNITAQSLLTFDIMSYNSVTVTMMSRITLNLMKSMKSPDKYQDQRGGLPLKSVRISSSYERRGRPES
ncbi:hypothetical protein J3R30DRAFT_3403081 [Lentinula aciculospora]|uniref:DUF6533 domain-containing protein n=1 Tax=Lentinula aciculospora TaxID=153920 RepID=A0A9W9AGW0_9AGAR|nr:hypothetical protein J3R30DRAFT_3403081 [Lentinula aciculospora]